MNAVKTYDFYQGYFNVYKLRISLRSNLVTAKLIRGYLKVDPASLRGVKESAIVAAMNSLLVIPDLYKQAKNDLPSNALPKQTANLLERAEKDTLSLAPEDFIRLNRELLENIYPFPANPVTLAMIKLLQEYRYTAWVSISFRNKVSVETARTRLIKFLKTLNRGHDPALYDNVMFYSAFYEKGDENKRTHIHLFTKGIPDNMLEVFQDRCCEEFGGTIIEGNHAGAIPYAAKKIHSPTLIELDIGKIIRAR